MHQICAIAKRRPSFRPRLGVGPGQGSAIRLRRSIRQISEVTKRSYPILDVAEKNQSSLERSFLALVQSIKDSISLRDLEEAIVRGGVETFLDLDTRMEAAAMGNGVPASGTSFLEAIQNTFRAGAMAELRQLEDVPVEKALKRPRLGSELSFNLLNPEATNFLQSYALNLIRQISRATRESIRGVILDAFKTGGHPYEQAREIRDLIGLTRTQAQAVRNFRRNLESGNPAQLQEALDRALRDKRFDSTVLRTIQQQTRLPKAKIDAMVQRYYGRYLTHRAQTIARTESLRASHYGQQELWRQATQQGLLNAERTRRKWIVTPDSRLCEICRPIPKMNPDGVRLEAAFNTPIGLVELPPAHVTCRCTVGLVFLPK